MALKKYVPAVLGVLFLAACTKKEQKQAMPALPGNMGGATPITGKVLYIGAGQSNMQNMNLTEDFLPLTQNPEAAVMNVAVGSTLLSQWEKGTAFYSNLVSQVKAMQALGYSLGGFLWWQGEAEGLVNKESHDWAQRFTRFIQNLRADLGAPSLPVVYARISNCRNGVDWDEIRRQQEMVSLPYARMVGVDDVPCGPDQLHYEPGQYKYLAQRFYYALNGL